MEAVRIPSQRGSGWIGFDLREVMAAVGRHAELEWSLHDVEFNCDVSTILGAGVDVLHRRAAPGGPGIPLDWATMEQIAMDCGQIVDGFFLGRDLAGDPQLILLADDSTFWHVCSTSPEVIASVRRSFSGVEPSDFSPEEFVRMARSFRGASNPLPEPD